METESLQSSVEQRFSVFSLGVLTYSSNHPVLWIISCSLANSDASTSTLAIAWSTFAVIHIGKLQSTLQYRSFNFINLPTQMGPKYIYSESELSRYSYVGISRRFALLRLCIWIIPSSGDNMWFQMLIFIVANCIWWDIYFRESLMCASPCEWKLDICKNSTIAI